jgi:hypothetical protein
MIDHTHLLGIMKVLPTDYADRGGTIERGHGDETYPDCSSGCRWAVWLGGPFADDWCVCANPKSPRLGLLTFEHQTGYGCFEK